MSLLRQISQLLRDTAILNVGNSEITLQYLLQHAQREVNRTWFESDQIVQCFSAATVGTQSINIPCSYR